MIKLALEEIKSSLNNQLFIFLSFVLLNLITLITVYYTPVIFHNLTIIILTNLNLILFFFGYNIISKLRKKEQNYLENRLHYQTAMILSENLHHELNTPLTVISNKINKLQKRSNDIQSGSLSRDDCPVDETVKDFTTLTASVTMIKDVLDRMKSFKNLKIYESKRTVYEIIKISCEIVKATNSDVFDYQIDNELKKYKVDSRRLKNGELTGIFINHIKNSIEAHATVVKFKMNSVGNNFISFYIADNGNGIPHEIATHIFDENTTSKNGENSDRGNGLFVNKFIVTQAGGYLGLIATSTKGTVFEICIPNIESTVEEQERTESDIIESLEKKIAVTDNIYKQVLDNLPDMVWFKDINGKYLIANKAIKEGLLFNENPIGKSDIELATAAKERFGDSNHTFGEKCANSDGITLDNGKSSKFLESGKIKGDILYLEVNKSIIKDTDGKILGVCGSGRDMTEYILAIKEMEGNCQRTCANKKVIETFKKYEFGEEFK